MASPADVQVGTLRPVKRGIHWDLVFEGPDRNKWLQRAFQGERLVVRVEILKEEP